MPPAAVEWWNGRQHIAHRFTHFNVSHLVKAHTKHQQLWRCCRLLRERVQVKQQFFVIEIRRGNAEHTRTATSERIVKNFGRDAITRLLFIDGVDLRHAIEHHQRLLACVGHESPILLLFTANRPIVARRVLRSGQRALRLHKIVSAFLLEI